jgi:hypothetical protein
MFLQTARNERVRSSGHLDVKISYKIKLLEVPKKVPILFNPPCFKEGLF